AGKNIARAAEGGIFSDDQGEDYFAWDDNNKIQDLVDEDVIVVLDLAGKALVLTTDANITSNTIYGIATYLQEGRTPVLTVFTTEGKEVEYKFEDRAEVNKFGASDVSTGAFDDTKFSAVSFKLNKDGEIKEKTLEVDSAALTLDKGSKDKFVKVSATEKYDLRTSTVFMKALNNGTAKKLKPSVIKYDDIIKRELTAETAYVIGEPNKDAKLIVFTDGAFEATDDTLFGLI
ncbi:hypothetical protein, partial [Stenotrophomonas maltophilia group sp. RNC7]|uniref:hypothetical protein n=1 Tax=Stenotrophomonas maltophilia group sp. RNC7 TaxID=3071467 RepID=UPI0027E058B2